MTTTPTNINTPVNDDQQLAVVANRILSRVVRTSAGCLEYTGRLDSQTGYSRVKYHGRNGYGHRIIAERFLGNPDGLQVHHVCANRACVAPGHLQLVTVEEHARLTAKQRKAVAA